MRMFLSKIRALFARNTSDREEIEAHIDLLIAHYEQQGMSVAEARKAARRQFGNSGLHQQRLNEMRTFPSLSSLGRDLRFAIRSLRKSPGFTLTAILTLALGIGAATAIFSIVDGVLLKPLAYPNSGQLVVVWERTQFMGKLFPRMGANPLHEQFFAQHNSTFSGISLIQERSAPVGLTGERPFLTSRIHAEPNLLDVLQVQPALGRSFLATDAIKGHENVAILTWPLWQSLFQGDPNVLGRTFHYGEAVVTVIGVMPRNFYFPKSTELSSGRAATSAPDPGFIMPIAGKVSDLGSIMGDFGNYVAIGRLKPGVIPQQAQAELDSDCLNLLREIPVKEMLNMGSPTLASNIQPLKDVIVNQSNHILWLLFAAVLSLLLIACINLANAQLARAAVRDREVAVRSALGASAWSLVQSAFAETLILSLAGSALGILLAFVAVHRIAEHSSLPLPRTGGLSIDTSVLALSLLLTVGATLLVGLLPALRQLRIRPQQALQNSTRTTGSRYSLLFRRWLIGAQVFACTALLLTTGLFARSLVRLLTLDKGFTSSQIFQISITLPGANDDAAFQAFADATLTHLRALPGVQSAALVSAILQGDTWQDGVVRPDHPDATSVANYRWISPGYFATLQQRIVEGRDLDEHDRGQRNAVISQATANAVWPGINPIGRQLVRNNEKPFTVVGIAADAHVNSLREPPTNMVYLPYWDRPSGQFLARSSQPVAALADSIRKTIWAYNPGAIFMKLQPLDEQIGSSISLERLETLILTAFGASALLLALLGIYGTLSYSVTTRRQEIGVRMALGATRGHIYTSTLREIVAPLAAGLLLGWLASLAIGRSITALLYNTAPNDPAVTLLAVTLFLVAATAATVLPCRRAANTNPMEALRAE